MTVLADRLPGIPTAVVMTPGDAQFGLAWSPPTRVGASPVTIYSLSCTHLVDGLAVAIKIPGPIESPMKVTDLDDGSAYTCVLTGTNAIGQGAPAKRTVTPRRTPDAPVKVEWTAGASSISVVWAPPETDGGAPITGYLITCVGKTGVRTVTASTKASAATIGRLTAGSSFDCSVAAKNVAGVGVASDPVAVTPL